MIDSFAQSLLDAYPEPILVVNLAGEICAANAAARRRFEDGAPIVGRLLPSMTLARADAIRRFLARCAAGAHARPASWTWRAADGRLTSYAVHGAPATLPADRRAILLRLAAPVAPHRRLADLSRQVRQLRTELDVRQDLEQRLGSMLSELEATNRAKSKFLAQMSHELRTPLNAIIGFAEIMLGEMFGALQPRYATYANDIRLSGQLLLEMIEEVLDLSRIEAGATTPNEETVDLRRVIEACVRLVEPRSRDKHLAIVLPAQLEPKILKQKDWKEFKKQSDTYLAVFVLKPEKPLRRLGLEVPARTKWMRLRLAPAAAGGYWLDIDFRSPTADAAREDLGAIQKTIESRRENPLSLLRKTFYFDEPVWAVKGPIVRGRARMSEEQLDLVLGQATLLLSLNLSK